MLCGIINTVSTYPYQAVVLGIQRVIHEAGSLYGTFSSNLWTKNRVVTGYCIGGCEGVLVVWFPCPPDFKSMSVWCGSDHLKVRRTPTSRRFDMSCFMLESNKHQQTYGYLPGPFKPLRQDNETHSQKSFYCWLVERREELTQPSEKTTYRNLELWFLMNPKVTAHK